MNTICNIRQELGGWRVEAMTPNGAYLVIFSRNSRHEAVETARWAEAEPA